MPIPDAQSNETKQYTAWRDGRRQVYAEPRAGADVEHTVVVTLREAYCGTTRQLIYKLANGEKRPVEFSIPPGVATGTRVRYAGHGFGRKKGVSPGDLYLLIAVQESPAFQRQGDNLFHHLSVPAVVLCRGGEVRVKTVDNKLLGLAIPPSTTDGQRFRLAGQGMPQLGKPDHRGDLFVTVKARLPGEREADYGLTDTSWDRDDTFAMLFFAMLFLAGIGAGLFLFWLILD
jgi:DnaJ-class molecular chaperone